MRQTSIDPYTHVHIIELNKEKVLPVLKPMLTW